MFNKKMWFIILILAIVVWALIISGANWIMISCGAVLATKVCVNIVLGLLASFALVISALGATGVITRGNINRGIDSIK